MDAEENAGAAEMKFAVFCALARLRTIMIEEFDTNIRLESYPYAAADNEVPVKPFADARQVLRSETDSAA